MRRFVQFLASAGKWGITLMTGGILSFTVGLIEHLSGRSFRAVTYTTVGCGAFLLGAFLAWRNERIKLEQEEQKRGRPEITADFKSFGSNPTQLPDWRLLLRNSSPFPAVDVHIEDIRYGDRVLRFMPPSALLQDVDYFVRCGILCNGWTETNDVLCLFLTNNSIPLSLPSFRLKIYFSSLDSSNRKHWIFSAFFWYDSQQRRLILSQQSIALAK